MTLPYSILTSIYYDSGDLEKARSYAEKTLELAQKNGEQRSGVVSNIFLGMILLRMESKKRKMAEELIFNGIKRLEEMGIRAHIVMYSIHIGELYVDTGQKKKAFEYLRKAESMSKEMGMDYWLGKAQEVLARL